MSRRTIIEAGTYLYAGTFDDSEPIRLNKTTEGILGQVISAAYGNFQEVFIFNGHADQKLYRLLFSNTNLSDPESGDD